MKGVCRKLDIKKYICSYEESISLIQDGINRYTQNELYSLINNAGVYNGIGMIVRNTFCHANYDDLGNVYLFDELNAKEITSYILNNPKYKLQPDLIYSCVCYTLQRVINEFYKDLALYERTGMVGLHYNRKSCELSGADYSNRYEKALLNRLTTGYKKIRRTVQH